MTDFIHVVAVEDYHDFGYMADSIKCGKVVKYHEYGLGDDRRYWGLIYTGRRPKQSEIRAMINAAGFVPSE